MAARTATHRAEWKLSLHAEARVQQRGVRRAALRLIERYGDSLEHQMGGRERIGLTQDTRRRLLARGVNPQTVSDAAKVCVILAADGTIVTCLHNSRLRPRRQPQWRRQ